MTAVTINDAIVVYYQRALNLYNQQNPNSTLPVRQLVNEFVNLANDSTVFTNEIKSFEATSNSDLRIYSPGIAAPNGKIYEAGAADTSGLIINVGLPDIRSIDPLAGVSVDAAAVFAGSLAHKLGHFFDRSNLNVYSDSVSNISECLCFL